MKMTKQINSMQQPLESVVNCLLRREIGLCLHNRLANSDIFEKNIYRLLVKSRVDQTTPIEKGEPRAPTEIMVGMMANDNLTKEITDPTELCKRRSVWTVLKLIDSRKLSIEMIEEKIFVRETQFSKQLRRVYSFLPYLKNQLKLQYFHENEKRQRWASVDLWYPSHHLPPPTGLSKKRIPLTLICLDKHSICENTMKGQKVVLHDFDKGNKLQEIFIGHNQSRIRYSKLTVYHEENYIVISSIKSSLPDAVSDDFLLCSYPPFEVYAHIQIAKSAFNKQTKNIEIMGGFIAFNYGNVLEVCDLNIAINEAKRPRSSMHNSVTHIIQQKPHALFKVNTTEFFFEIIPMAWPPLCLIKNEDVFQIVDTNHKLVAATEILEVGEDEDNTLSSHPDGQSRVLFGGRNGYRILELVRNYNEDGFPVDTSLIRIFPKEDQKAVCVEATRFDYGKMKARVLRKIPPRSYKEKSSDVHGFDYNSDLDLFAIIAVSKKHMHVSLYDNVTMNLFAILEPVELTKDILKDGECLQFTVHFNSTFIGIEFKSRGNRKFNIYCLNLVADHAVALLD